MNILLKIADADYGSNLMSKYGITETLLFGLEMLLLGMGAVFAVLCLIWGCLSIFSLVFSKNKKSSAKKVAAPDPVQVVTPVTAASQNDEIVAVIAAAIAMAESEGNGAKFRVVSFTRK